MWEANNILLVRVTSLEGVDYREMRDAILESVRLGVLILGMGRHLRGDGAALAGWGGIGADVREANRT